MDPTPSKQLNNSRALIIRVLLFITLLLPTLLFANLYEEEQLTEEALESNIATTQSLTSIEQLKEIYEFKNAPTPELYYTDAYLPKDGSLKF